MHALVVNQHAGANAGRRTPVPFTATNLNDLKAAIAGTVTNCPFVPPIPLCVLAHLCNPA